MKLFDLLWMPPLLLAAVGGASAAAAATGESLTLQRTVQLALQRNEAPAIAQSRIEQARAARREAWARLLPRLTVNATYTRHVEEVTREFGGQKGVFQALDALGAVASGRLMLLDAPAIPRVRAAGRELEAQREEAAQTRRLLAFETAETFLVALSAEALERAALRRQEQARAWQELAAARLQAGLASQLDVTRAQLEVASAALALTRAQAAVRSARLALAQLIVEDEPVSARLLPPPPPASPPAGAAPGAAALAPGAVARRPDLRAADLRAEAARLAAQEPWLRLVPSLAFDAGLRLTNETGFTGRNWDYTLALTLSWELYDGGARYAQAHGQAARRQEARLLARLKRREVRREITSALIDLHTARAALVQSRAQQELAVQHGEQARARYGQGLASALELADAATAAFEAEVEVARQELAERSARFELLKAAGEWPVAVTTQREVQR